MESLNNTLVHITAPISLAQADQTIELYDNLEPTWVDVQFKQPMRSPWDWHAFFRDATSDESDLGLTVAGLVLSRASEKTPEQVETILATLGFDHLRSSHYHSSGLYRNAVSDPARTFAHKAIGTDDGVVHVICAVFRGTTSLEDILTDIKSVKDGFFDAGKNCADALETYVQGIEGATKENTILFLTGHSLGGASANIVGRLTRKLAKESARFVYTYASPNYECDGEDGLDRPFSNFHTFSNAADVVPTQPPGFSRIGIEHSYDRSSFDEARRERFELVYHYFCGVSFDEHDYLSKHDATKDLDPKYNERYKNHVTSTYMSLILSELSDEELGRFLVKE